MMFGNKNSWKHSAKSLKQPPKPSSLALTESLSSYSGNLLWEELQGDVIFAETISTEL